MSISPISFRGQITIKTYKSNNPKDITVETIKTTKQQDGMLLKAAVNTLQSIGYKEHVYPHETKNFHTTLENIVGRPIEQAKGGEKFFYMGGVTGTSSDYKPYLAKYNTSYNKLFYNDQSFNRPLTCVTVDFMEPEERLTAAMKKLSNIQQKIETIFNCKTSDPNFSHYSYKVSPKNYSTMEEILANTEMLLNGYFEGPDLLDKTKQFADSKEAYNALIKNLMKASGMNYRETSLEIPTQEQLSKKDMNNIRRAVHYLENSTPKLYK